MNNFFQKINQTVRQNNQWFVKIPERALEQAYQAALKIKSIEDEHFGGEKISSDTTIYSKNTLDCFLSDLNSNLNLIKLKTAEFKLTRTVLQTPYNIFAEKLNFIDFILEKYQDPFANNDSQNNKSLVVAPKTIKVKSRPTRNKNTNFSSSDFIEVDPMDSPNQKTGAFPRSIGRTIQKITTELDEDSEEKIVKNFRNSKQKTRAAINFILLLIIIPLLSQQVSKQFVFFPLAEEMRPRENSSFFINDEMKEEAFRKLQFFEEEIKFDELLKKSPRLTNEEIEEKVKLKAEELAEEFYRKSNIAISNVFADIVGLVAFVVVLFANQKGLNAFKCLLDNLIYDLSDSAKAFILILFTDIFVGFHSPHGWEVLLEGLSIHLGIPANHNFIFLFIATFPVVLDTIFKYWIFRYLNQISPSAVATLKNMNE